MQPPVVDGKDHDCGADWGIPSGLRLVRKDGERGGRGVLPSRHHTERSPSCFQGAFLWEPVLCVALSGLRLKSLLSLRWCSAAPIPSPHLGAGLKGTEGQDSGLPGIWIARRQRTSDHKAYFLKCIL